MLTTDVTVTNPYDYIGQMHNQGLDFIINTIYSSSCAVNETTVIKLSSQFVSQFCTFCEVSPISLEAGITNVLNYRKLDLLPPVDNPVQSGFINDLLNIADLFVNPFEHLESINTQINDLNKNVFLSNLTVEEKIPIFCASSVYVNSLYYWNQVIQTEDNKWAIYITNQEVSFLGLNWGKVGKEDLKGALPGAIAGGIGALFTGGGILLGALGGALGGGVSTSVIEVIEQAEKEADPEEGGAD